MQALAVGHNMRLCATDWWGLTQADEALAARVVANLSRFPVLVDRLQQAVLNTLFLARLMVNPAGLSANPAFQAGGGSVLDTSHVYYYGNSQGGIIGGVLAAVSPDVRRGVLGVTGMDYGNLLLARSVDFTSFSQFLGIYYPDHSMYPVILDLLDQLWDRADPDGYASVVRGGLPGTPSHEVLMQIAYGDSQVSMYAAAAEARRSGRAPSSPPWTPSAVAIGTCSGGYRQSGASPTAARRSRSGTAAPGGCSRRRSGTSRPWPARPTSTRIRTRATPRRPSSRSRTFLQPDGAVTDVCAGQPCHSSVYAP